MKRKKLNYGKLIFANLLIICLYLFIAIQLSYDLIEQILFACIFGLIVFGFNLFIIDNN